MKQSLYRKSVHALTRRQQVLLLSPLHLLLIAVVPLLFILTFAASFASTAPKKALGQLKQYLASIGQADLSSRTTKEALVGLEKRLNSVKTHCTPEALRSDTDLMSLLQSVLMQIAAYKDTGKPFPPSLRMFAASINHFYTVYFPGAPTVFSPDSGRPPIVVTKRRVHSLEE